MGKLLAGYVNYKTGRSTALSEMTVEHWGKDQMWKGTFPGLPRIVAPAVVAACALGATTSAMASGFALREGSADWMANGFAGDTAKAYDAATVWSNPAGMVRLNQNEIDSSIDGIFPTINFSGVNIVGPAATTPGTTAGNLIQSAATGGVYALWSLSPDFKLGLAADAPFGQRVANPITFVGRYQSLVSSISDEQVTLSGAYRINDQWSIGGGPVIDFFSARLTQALNIGPASAITGDPYADVHGQDTSAGFNFGALYQPTPALRFGLDYRSRIPHGIDGTQSVSVPPLLNLLSPASAAVLSAQNSAAGTKITLPDSVTGGVYWQATPELALLMDLSWTDWSLLKAINIVPASPLAAPTTILENWRNTVAVSVGANYNLTRQIMLQGGVGFDRKSGHGFQPHVPHSRQQPLSDQHRSAIRRVAQPHAAGGLLARVLCLRRDNVTGIDDVRRSGGQIYRRRQHRQPWGKISLLMPRSNEGCAMDAMSHKPLEALAVPTLLDRSAAASATARPCRSRGGAGPMRNSPPWSIAPPPGCSAWAPARRQRRTVPAEHAVFRDLLLCGAEGRRWSW